MKKVLVIGLDGATFDNLKPWIKGGKLPNFANILENGVHGPLKSTIPSLTAPAWTSFFTGKNPGKHGVFDFFIPQSGYSLQLVDSTHRKSKPIWVLISDAKAKAGVVNMPMTYPPDRFNGFMISGFGTPRFDESSTFPKSLWSEISKEVPGYMIHETEDFFHTGDRDKFVKSIFSRTKKRASAVKYLMNKKEWDFFTVVFRGPDQIQHHFWKFMDSAHPDYNQKDGEKYGNVLLTYYQKIDNILGDILRGINNETTVILVSDHGSIPAYKGIYLNNWLIEKKLLQLKKGIGIGSILAKIRSNVVHLIRKYNLRTFSKYIPRRIRKNMYSPLNVNWSQTKIYFMSQGGGYLMVNLRGRESKGTVEPGKEYEDLRGYVISELYNLVDPGTGEKIIDKVYKREEIYTGPYVKNAPDLFIIPKRGYHPQVGIGRKDLIGPLTYPNSKKVAVSGVHDINGIFMIKGPSVKKGEVIENPKIIDITPTILYIMGLPIPKDMDGTVLTEVFEKSFLAENQMVYREVEDEKERIHEKIRDLKAICKI